MAQLITPSEVDQAHAAAQKVVETHRRLVEFLRTGQTLAQIDAFVAETLRDLGCRSAFLGYRQARTPAFPSHACLSLNECIVHGTAGMTTEPMRPGDILKIDIGVVYRGWIGDAAWTYAFEHASDEARRLMDCGKECLRRGVETLKPGGVYLDFARAVQEHAETECGFHCVRGLGGHGYGRKLHAPPYVANHAPSYPGEWPDAFTRIEPGTLLAVEPMLAAGTAEVSQQSRQWPVFTGDGSLSVHYEHDVYVSEDGPRVLTEGLEELEDVVGKG
ncbi:MAG: type I methionyl aminopeptidase [Phycisphaeraceae bacterium]|nr:MAG: type I methionyl aminopeptidase [Phycisphaeraceae bacterium]